MMGKHNSKGTKGRAVFLAATMVLSVFAVAALGLPAVAQDSPNNIDSAERTINGSTDAVVANPGDEVDVTVTVTLGPDASSGEGNFGLDEDFPTEFGDVSLGVTNYNGEFFGDAITVSDNTFVSANIERGDAPGGNYAEGDTIVQKYTVTVPEDASDGDEFTIEGTAELGNDVVDTSGPSTITVDGPATGPLDVAADPGQAGEPNSFTYTFDATGVSDQSDIQTILIDFDDASGVDATAIAEDDVTVNAAGSTPGVDATAEASAGVLKVTLSDTFVLGNADGDVVVDIAGVDVPNDGSFDGGIEFQDGGGTTIATGSGGYSIAQASTPTPTPTPDDGTTPTPTPTPDDGTTPTPTDDFAESDGPGLGVVAALIALLSAALLARRRL